MTANEMLENINELSADEIKALMMKIRKQNEGWKNCKDGSYEMALAQCGYMKLFERLCQLQPL